MIEQFDLSKVNLENLQVVINRLESLPDNNFDINSWIRGPKPYQALNKPECGTTLCIVGALAAAEELDFSISPTGLIQTDPDNCVSIEDHFADGLGIDLELARQLIHNDEYNDLYDVSPEGNISKQDVLKVFYYIQEAATHELRKHP